MPVDRLNNGACNTDARAKIRMIIISETPNLGDRVKGTKNEIFLKMNPQTSVSVHFEQKLYIVVLILQMEFVFSKIDNNYGILPS